LRDHNKVDRNHKKVFENTFYKLLIKHGTQTNKLNPSELKLPEYESLETS